MHEIRCWKCSSSEIFSLSYPAKSDPVMNR